MAALGGQSAFMLSYVAPEPVAPVRTTRPASRRAARLAAATVPLTRCAVVVLSAGLLLGGHPAGGYTGFGGPVQLSAGERALDAHASRLTAEAHARADAARSEALAVAAAALDAAAAVQPLTVGLAVEEAPGGFGAAVERLSGLVATAAAADAGPLAAMASDAAVPVVADPRPAADLRLSADLEGTAAEVFRLSMQVESLSAAAAAAQSADRSLDLVVLEQAVASVQVTATELGELEPLVPLPEPEPEPAGESEPAGVERRTAARVTTSSGARLSADAPAGVVALVERWSNGAIPAGELCPVPFAPGARLQCDAAAALADLNEAYRAEFGADLAVTSSYRTYEAQVALKATKGGLAATPGTSNHGWGLAVDLGGIGGLGQFDSPRYRWLKANAERYGWHHPRVMEPGGSGPQEPWHWEFGTA